MIRRLLVLGATVTVALVVTGAAPTAAEPPAAQIFASTYHAQTGVGVAFGIAKFGEGPSMAKATIYIPSGYRLDLSRPPGSRIGETFVAVLFNGGFTSGSGTVSTGDPAALPGDAAAQACSPGTHAAVWIATYQAARSSGAVRFYVDPTTGPEASLGAFRLVACFVSPDATPEGPYFIQFELGLAGPGGSVLTPPARAGTYIWRGFVTPYVDGTTTPDPGATYEARTHVLVPHVITERARYRSRSQQLVVTGRLFAAGHPRRRTLLDVVAAPGGGVLRLLGHTRTRNDGRYSLVTRVREGLRARVYDVWVLRREQPGLCQGASPAPAGCVDDSISPPPSALAHVRIPRLPKR